VVIARQNDALALGNRNPAAGLQRLCGFVDEDGVDAQVTEVPVAGCPSPCAFTCTPEATPCA
jgi:hypothetical protein